MKKTRRAVQFGFLAIVVGGIFAVGANCERWCPFGGVEGVYTYASEGNMLCSLGVSNFFILGGVLLITVLLRRAFCGYMCPLGTISEWLRGLARRLGVPGLRVPHRVDRVLASLKYAVLAVILVATYRAGELIFRGFDPCYALITMNSPQGTDIADITVWAYVVAGAIALASLVMVMPFCRWFCPMAAVLSPISRFALTRIERDAEACRGCGQCSEHCPTAIPVDQLQQVKAARCLSCMNCVDSCPRKGKGDGALRWRPPRWLGPRWPQAALIGILLACTTAAVAASYLFAIPSFVKTHGDPPAEVTQIRLQVKGLTCRGRANQFFYFLQRDDLWEVPGYFKVEAWPGPDLADVIVTFDPAATDERAIQRAITAPYYDAAADFARRDSPFRIEGYDPTEIDIDRELDALLQLP
ncbi:MAG TPA: 4Fe-4S binding protein [Thermoguttaceae bacterium]|nr:4Fe-4S binding protein [Thermoguttaceae bacterium]